MRPLVVLFIGAMLPLAYIWMGWGEPSDVQTTAVSSAPENASPARHSFGESLSPFATAPCGQAAGAQAARGNCVQATPDSSAAGNQFADQMEAAYTALSIGRWDHVTDVNRLMHDCMLFRVGLVREEHASVCDEARVDEIATRVDLLLESASSRGSSEAEAYISRLLSKLTSLAYERNYLLGKNPSDTASMDRVAALDVASRQTAERMVKAIGSMPAPSERAQTVLDAFGPCAAEVPCEALERYAY